MRNYQNSYKAVGVKKDGNNPNANLLLGEDI